MAIARYFEASKWDKTLPMVGLADIADEEWELLPKYVQRQVDSLPYFRKTKPDGGGGQTVTIPDPVYDDFSAPVVVEAPAPIESAPVEVEAQSRRTTMKLTKET